MTTNGQQYSDTGREFFARARTYLAEDELLHASVQAWAAAAHVVAAAAEARDWPHTSHRDLYAAVDGLVAETNEGSIRTGFALAGALETNSYEGWLPHATVEAYLGEVAHLVEKLDGLPV